ncbi:MAG TPA: hypothetical protein DCO77_13330 [Nitrospiraceae bacterium]|nr:hypothetical protein [Nitrospiraceae bacterium]
MKSFRRKRGSKTAFVVLVAAVLMTISSMPQARAQEVIDPTCRPDLLKSADIFFCIGREDLPPIQFGPPDTFLDVRARRAFPQQWDQLGADQRHNPVFPVPDTAPAFLRFGTFWAAPLTGLDFQRLGRALETFGNPESWGSKTAQNLGNVMGVSAAQGIVYVQLGRHEIWALDGATGEAIWNADLTTAAGMGQAIVQEVEGRLTVFVPSGDASFTVQNAIDFSNGEPHDRGANFTGLYAFDGVTGRLRWRFATKGAARPTPVYRNGKLYLATSGGEFFVLDAATGKQLGTFINPGEGFPGLASLNWYETDDGRLLLFYGTIRPRRILAVDATDPAAPVLGWSYTPPSATANAPGDTPVAIDPDLGLVFTTVFSSVSGQFTLNVLALDAATGTVQWSDFAGGQDSPPGYKGSVPMVHNGRLYVGNTSNGRYRAYEAATGALLWEADLAEADDPPGLVHRQRAAAVFFEGKLIFAEGRDIHTFDPDTGQELNRFETPGTFGVWGINQPVIIGRLMILGSISGWVFAAPVDYITNFPGVRGENPLPIPTSDVTLPPQLPDFFNPLALPTAQEANQFPGTWLAYAGGQEHNGVAAQGPSNVSWQTALNSALPLDARPMDEGLYGTEIATHMTHLAYGVGTGVSPARGILFVGSDRYTINALNALTGRKIWRFRTINANFGQPLVTPSTVIVSGGDPWMNLGQTGRFRSNSPATVIGDSFPTVHGLDPETGKEKWTVYSSSGTSAMTPLYHDGNLYWVNGEARVWAVNADTGEPMAPFMNIDGLPTLSLGGFNAISSANIYRVPGGPDLMIVGTAMPNRIWAIDLAAAQVVWTHDLAGVNTYVTGFAAVPPTIGQSKGMVISTVLADADTTTGAVTMLAFALDGKTGELLWTEYLGEGVIPTGFTGAVPLVDKSVVYLHNPLDKAITALDAISGTVRWQAAVTAPDGQYSWCPGVVTGNKLIQPVGPDLYTLDAKTGVVLNQLRVGGSFTYNNPSVVGKTLYIGNSWGWVTALPVDVVIGEASQ